MKIKLPLKKINFEEFKEQFNGIESFDDLLNAGPAPKIATLALIFIGIVSSGYFFISSPVLDEISMAQSKQEELKKQYIEAHATASNLKKYQQDLQDTEASVENLLKQLPNKSNIDMLLNDVNRAGLGRDLLFVSFTPKPEEVRENFYASLPIDMKIEGNFDNIGQFASDVSKLDRIVIFDKFNLKPKENMDKKNSTLTADKNILSMTMVAETYRYLDEDELKALDKNNKNKKKDKKEKGDK